MPSTTPVEEGEPVVAQKPDRAPSTPGWRIRFEPIVRRRGPLAIHLLTLVAAGITLTVINRNNWFWYDDWEFVHRDTHPLTVDSLLRPHNEHWSTIPLLIYRLLYDTVGLQRYGAYMAVLFAMHLALAHLLWRLLLRCLAPWTVATAAVAVFAVLGAGWENLTWAFQIGFVGSVALGVAGLFVLGPAGPPRRRDLLYWPIGLAALTCSSIGVPLVVTAGAVAVLRRGWRVGALVVSVPAAAFLLWYWEYGRNVGSSELTPIVILQLPEFVWQGIVADLEGFTGMAGAGGALAIAAAVGLYRQRGDGRGRLAPAFGLVAGLIAFELVVGAGRLSLVGIATAGSFRYVYIGVALLLVPATVALSPLLRRSPGAQLLVCTALTGSLLYNTAELRGGKLHWQIQREQTRAVILAAAGMVRQGIPVLAAPDDRVSIQWAEPLHVSDLEELVRAGKLPPAEPPTTDAARGAAAGLLVGVAAAPRLPLGQSGPRFIEASGATVSISDTGCRRIHVDAGATGLVRLRYGQPASVRIVSQNGGTLTINFATPDAPTTFVGPRSEPLAAGVPTYLDQGVADAVPVVTPPPGDTTLCGLSN